MITFDAFFDEAPALISVARRNLYPETVVSQSVRLCAIPHKTRPGAHILGIIDLEDTDATMRTVAGYHGSPVVLTEPVTTETLRDIAQEIYETNSHRDPVGNAIIYPNPDIIR